MSQVWARTVLSGYRWLGAGIYPFLGTYLAVRAAKGKEEHNRRKERYGHPSQPRPEGPLVWFHAASVGETTAVLPLIAEVQRRSINVILTTGTVTSASIVKERAEPGVIHQYVPLDLKPAIGRFLDYWKPDLAIIAESEIWPMTILELGARRMPQVLVNGRLSDRSFASWKRRINLAEALFENLSHVIAQSDVDAERFRLLGARPVTVSGNLKVDTAPPPVDGAALTDLRAQIGDRKTWCAISTFSGEEELAADVHAKIKALHNPLTILVPRHPERCDGIYEMLVGKGLKVVRRTSGDPIEADTDIFLGDTIGEMGLYLSLSDIAFVGRSIASSTGGQNPLEPAMMGCAVLSGPNVQNFRETYQTLLEKNGAKLVKDGAMLAKAVSYLMANPGVRSAMVAAGTEAIDQLSGPLDRTIKALEPYINPLTLKARLNPTYLDDEG